MAYFVLLFAAILPGFAQSTDDLPSAPSAVHQSKPAPKQASESQTTQSASPSSSVQPAAQPSSPVASAESTDNKDSTGVIREGETTIITTVNEVNVVFTVTDRHNRYVKDLTKGDFKVVDNSLPVADIRSFRRESDLPLQVGLLIDASNSIRDRFKFEQESAIEFLNDTIRRHYDQAFVVGFDEAPELTQDFTDNTELLSQGVRSLRPGGGTAMYDALYYACRDKLLQSSQTGDVRRAIILVSDGDDNYSHVTRDEAIEMALRANVIVYTISTNYAGLNDSKYDKVLEQIADATGGRAFEPFQLTDVANAFSEVQADLRSQYELSYRPENFAHDGSYRAIEITTLHKGLKVRSRSGYYAPAE